MISWRWIIGSMVVAIVSATLLIAGVFVLTGCLMQGTAEGC